MGDFKRNPEYEPQNIDECLGYLVEECGEVMAAAGKIMRWGYRSANPELPKNKQEMNVEWLARELMDLENAVKYMKQEIKKHYDRSDEGVRGRC